MSGPCSPREGWKQFYDYIAKDNPHAAENVVRHLLVETAGLVTFPMIGHEGKRTGTRELVLSKYPYTVIYRLTANKVRIVAVLHQSKQYP